VAKNETGYTFRVFLGLMGLSFIAVMVLLMSYTNPRDVGLFILCGLFCLLGFCFIYRAVVGFPPAKDDPRSGVRVYTKHPPPGEG
jgi:hypothetical protein